MTTKKRKTATYTIVIAGNRVGRYSYRIPAFPDLGFDFAPSSQWALQTAHKNIIEALTFERWRPDRKPTKHALRRKGTIVTRVRVRLPEHVVAR